MIILHLKQHIRHCQHKATPQQSYAAYSPTDQNNSNVATICTPILTLFGNDCTSSQKLTVQIINNPHRNGRYGTMLSACTTIITAHIIMDKLKMTPPPLNTVVEWELLSFGLSMILHLSAMRK